MLGTFDFQEAGIHQQIIEPTIISETIHSIELIFFKIFCMLPIIQP